MRDRERKKRKEKSKKREKRKETNEYGFILYRIINQIVDEVYELLFIIPRRINIDLDRTYWFDYLAKQERKKNKKEEKEEEKKQFSTASLLFPRSTSPFYLGTNGDIRIYY